MRPKKPQTKLTVRFPPEVLDALRLRAEQHQRSLNGEIIWILRVHLDQQATAADNRET